MDLTSIESSVATAVLTIGAVSLWLKKYTPKALHYFHIARDAVDALEDIAQMCEDDLITPEEIKKIQEDIKKFREDLK